MSSWINSGNDEQENAIQLSSRADSASCKATELNPLDLKNRTTEQVPQEDKGLSQRISERLLLLVGSDAWNLWFASSANFYFSKTSHEGRCRLEVASDFTADCIRSFYLSEVRDAVHAELGPNVGISVTTAMQMPIEKAMHIETISQATQQPVQVIGVERSTRPANISRNLADAEGYQNSRNLADAGCHSDALVAAPHFLPITEVLPVKPRGVAYHTRPVSEFLPGAANRIAMAAAEMIFERPGEFGPLFLHGPNGVGKTHYAKMVAAQLKQRHKLRRVIYMTAEQFTIDFSESTRGAGFAAFRKKYRDVEAFLLDDVQFLVGKIATLAELRNTLEDLLGRRRQVIVCSDRSLADLTALGPDVHARISGGITCGLQTLDGKLRRDLLASLCKQYEVSICEEALDELALRTGGDGRSICGLVFRLMAQQRSKDEAELVKPLTLQDALSCSMDLIHASQPIVRLSDIERVVCDSFGLEPKSLKAKNRSKSISGPRMLAMFLARKHTQAAYAEIGDYFGNRQHSTVIAAQKRVEDWLQQNERLGHRSGTLTVRDAIRNAEILLQVG